jgi:nucleotide-binding universal stress UspA family protein
MKKILFPTDFSNVANNAFLHALKLAKLVKGELLLLHTYELPIMDNQFGMQNYKLVYDAIELTNLDLFKEELPKLHQIAQENELDSIKMSHILADGDLLYNIKTICKKEKIDYLVMGTAGATGWVERLFGTKTGEAITSLEVPVFCIPENAKYTKLETIGFTTRFREKDKLALKQVLKIANAANAVVKCIYVETKDTDNTDAVYSDWRDYFKDQPVHFFIIPSENVKETIEDFIISQEIDLLALLSYKRNFFQWMFTSSFTEKMALNSTIPIVALHE